MISNIILKFIVVIFWLQIDCPPHLIMGEVLKALQHLEVSWKIVGAYYAKCKWVPPSPKAVSRYESVAEGKRCQSSALTQSSNATLQTPIKFEAQVWESILDLILCSIILIYIDLNTFVVFKLALTTISMVIYQILLIWLLVFWWFYSWSTNFEGNPIMKIIFQKGRLV